MSSPDQIVILGASGDLTVRMLLPALARLAYQGRPPAGFSVLGVASNAEFLSARNGAEGVVFADGSPISIRGGGV